ncbi:hypothetical protein [Jatrophihabitans sp.]|uniref:hypothetical protein n=1 Tax=Jatrophihabitans sp. TaxID=1932789 RepID=UPI0030C72598|nr:hypothetical protein [Jatrophihabitans sp.]
MSVKDDLSSAQLLARVAAAASRTRDARVTLEDAQRTRDELMVDAVDAGISQRAVAEAAGVSRSRLIGVLGNHGFEEFV